MHLARLLLAALSLCSLPAFAQDPQPASSSSPTQLMPNVPTDQATASEPWRSVPKHELNPEWLQNPSGDYQILYGGYETVQRGNVTVFLPDSQTHSFVQLPQEQFLAENTCYAIRSYLVARDEKDSDSTHPVKVSSCQPARRYRLKNADSRPVSDDR